MTVVVGFVGPDGAVMASDSEATESGHTRFDVDKIWVCEGLLFGYTGTGGVRQPLTDQFKAVLQANLAGRDEVPRRDVRDLLQAATKPVLEQRYALYTGGRMGPVPGQLAGRVLVVGRDADGYWLLEIDEHNTATFYDDNGFHTVGSGSAAAYVAFSLMKDYAPLGRSVAHLKLIACRTVQACIDTVGGSLGVGGEVRLWYSEGGGPFGKAPDDEMAKIANGVTDWQGIERESLDKVVLPKEGAEPEEEIMLPEAIGDEPDAPEAPPGSEGLAT